MVTLDFSNTKIEAGRPIHSYAKVQSLVSAIIRNKTMFANLKGAGCYLDLGCGPNVSPDYCNLDFTWRPGVDVCWDVTKPLPFEDAYVSGIFTEHMLEHIPFESGLALLRECRRILRPGGVVRIVVPDGELYLSEYMKHHSGLQSSMPYADETKRKFGFDTPIVSVNRLFREHGHQFIWDHETLRAALFNAGFERVERRAFQESADPKLLRDSENRRSESLYVEAS